MTVATFIAYSAGVPLGARVHIFLLGHHLRFGNCGAINGATKYYAEGVGVKWKNE